MPNKGSKGNTFAPSFFGSQIGGLNYKPAAKKPAGRTLVPLADWKTPVSSTLQAKAPEYDPAAPIKLKPNPLYEKMLRDIEASYKGTVMLGDSFDEAKARLINSKYGPGVQRILSTYDKNRKRQAKLEELVSTGRSSSGADLDEIMYKFDVANFGRPTYGNVAGLTPAQVKKRSDFRKLAAGKVSDASILSPEQLQAKDLGLQDELGQNSNMHAMGRKQLREDLEAAGLGTDKYTYTPDSPIWEHDQAIATGLFPQAKDAIMGMGAANWSNTSAVDSGLMTYLHTAGRYNPITGAGNLFAGLIGEDRLDKDIPASAKFSTEGLNLLGNLVIPAGIASGAARLGIGGATAAATAAEAGIARSGVSVGKTLFQSAMSKTKSLSLNAMGHAIMANAPELAYQSSKMGAAEVAKQTAEGFAKGLNPWSDAQPHERLGSVATLIGLVIGGAHFYGKAKFKIAEARFKSQAKAIGLGEASDIAASVAEAKANPARLAEIVADGKNFTPEEVSAYSKFRDNVGQALEKVRPGNAENDIDSDLIARVTLARYKKTMAASPKSAPSLAKAMPEDTWHGVMSDEDWKTYVDSAKKAAGGGTRTAYADESKGVPAEDSPESAIAPELDFDQIQEIINSGSEAKGSVKTDSTSTASDDFEKAANAVELGAPKPQFKPSGKYRLESTKFEDISKAADGLYATGSNKIALFKDADLNTAIHEDAHRWLDIMPPEFQTDWIRLVTGKQDKFTAADRQNAHEAWAVMTEKYLKDGRLPAGTPGFAEEGVKALVERMRAPRENTTGSVAIERSGVTPEQFGAASFPETVITKFNKSKPSPKPAPKTPEDQLRQPIGLDESQRGKQWMTSGKAKKSIVFENDLDEAAYAATRTKLGHATRAERIKFIQERTGMSEEQIIAHGNKVAEVVEAAAKSRRGVKLTINQVPLDEGITIAVKPAATASPEVKQAAKPEPKGTPKRKASQPAPQPTQAQEPLATSDVMDLIRQESAASQSIDPVTAPAKKAASRRPKTGAKPSDETAGATDMRDVDVRAAIAREALDAGLVDGDITDLLLSKRDSPEELQPVLNDPEPKRPSMKDVGFAAAIKWRQSNGGDLVEISRKLADKFGYPVERVTGEALAVYQKHPGIINDHAARLIKAGDVKSAPVDAAKVADYTATHDSTVKERAAADAKRTADYLARKKAEAAAKKAGPPVERMPDGELDIDAAALKAGYGTPKAPPASAIDRWKSASDKQKDAALSGRALQDRAPYTPREQQPDDLPSEQWVRGNYRTNPDAVQRAADYEQRRFDEMAKQHIEGVRQGEAIDRGLNTFKPGNLYDDRDLADLSPSEADAARALKKVLRQHVYSLNDRDAIPEFLNRSEAMFENFNHRTPYVEVMDALKKSGASQETMAQYKQAYSKIYGKPASDAFQAAHDASINRSIGALQRNLIKDLARSNAFNKTFRDGNEASGVMQQLSKLVRQIKSGDPVEMQKALNYIDEKVAPVDAKSRASAFDLANVSSARGVPLEFSVTRSMTPRDILRAQFSKMSRSLQDRLNRAMSDGHLAIDDNGDIKITPKLLEDANRDLAAGDYDSPTIQLNNTLDDLFTMQEAGKGRPVATNGKLSPVEAQQAKSLLGIPDDIQELLMGESASHGSVDSGVLELLNTPEPGEALDISDMVDKPEFHLSERDHPLDSTDPMMETRLPGQPITPEGFFRSKWAAIKGLIGSARFDGLRTIMDAVIRSGAGDVAEAMGRIQYDSESLFGTSRHRIVRDLSRAFPGVSDEAVKQIFNSGMQKAAAENWDKLTPEELKAVQAYQHTRAALKSMAEKLGMLIPRNVDNHMLMNREKFIGKQAASEVPNWQNLPAAERVRTPRWVRGKIVDIIDDTSKGYYYDNENTGLALDDKPSQIVVKLELPDGTIYEHVPEPKPGVSSAFKTSSLIDDANYVPRVYSQEAVAELAGAAPGDPIYQKVVDHMLRNGAARTHEQAINLVDRIRQFAFNRIKDPQSRIEHARLADVLPQEFYSSNYFDDIMHDMKRLTSDIIWTKEMGDDHQLIRRAADEPGTDAERLINGVNDFMQSIGLFGKTESQQFWATAASKEGYYETAINMGLNPSSSVKQISTFSNTAAFFGEKNAATSIAETIAAIKDNRDWHNSDSPLARVRESGAIEAYGFGLEEGDRRHLMGLDSPEGVQAVDSSKINKFVTASTKPFEQMDLLTRVSSALASEKWLKEAVDKLKLNPSNKYLLQMMHDRYRFTPEDIDRIVNGSGLNKNDLHRAYQFGVDVQIRATDGRTIRVLQTLPGWRIAARFKTFDIGQWYNVKRALSEAKAGNMGTISKMLGYGVANGYAISAITGLIKDGIANAYSGIVSSVTGSPVQSGIANQDVVKRGLADAQRRVDAGDFIGAGLVVMEVATDSILSSGTLGTPGAVAQNIRESYRYDNSSTPAPIQGVIDYFTPAVFDKLVKQPSDAATYGVGLYKGSGKELDDTSVELGMDPSEIDQKKLTRKPVSALESFARSSARLIGGEVPAAGLITKNFEPSMTGSFKANLTSEAASAMRNYGLKFRPRRFSQPGVNEDGSVREPTLSMQIDMNKDTGRKFSLAVAQYKANGLGNINGVSIPLLDSPVDIMRSAKAFEAIARSMPGTRDMIGGRKLSELSDSELKTVSKRVVDFYEQFVNRTLQGSMSDVAVMR